MRTLAQIELVVLTRLNNLRCIQRLIASREFKLAFDALEPEKKEVVLTAIELGDKDEIIKLIDTNYLTSGNYIDYFEDSDNIIARLNNFIYFNRVNYKSNNLFFEGIKNSINQVLYDAQHVSGFSGNHNILK